MNKMDPKDRLKTEYDFSQLYVKDVSVRSQQPIAGQQCAIQFPETHSRKDTENGRYKSRQLLIFKEALDRLQHWVIDTVENYIGNIGKDVEKISELSRQQDLAIHQMYSSNLLLGKSYSGRVHGLIMKSEIFDKRTREVKHVIDQNGDRLRELRKQSSHCKKTVHDNIIQNNTQLILEICQIRDEVEVIKTRFHKEYAASDERRRISMDSTRYRLLTSNSYTKNAFTVWKEAVFIELARTGSRLKGKLEDQKQYWEREMESVRRKMDEDLETLGRNIVLVEDGAKRRIQNVIKKVDKLKLAVNEDTSNNEEFRKIMKTSMTVNKGQSERLLRMKNDLATKIREIDETLNTMGREIENQYATFLHEIKDHNEEMNKQINDLSRQIKLLTLRLSYV